MPHEFKVNFADQAWSEIERAARELGESPEFVGYLNTTEGIERFPEGRFPGKTPPRCPECRMTEAHKMDCSRRRQPR